MVPLGRSPLGSGPGPDSERLSGPGIRAFFNIAKEWSLTTDEQMALLGLSSRSTLFAWKRAKDAKLDRDQLERVSHLLGIYKSLRILFSSDESARTWVKKPNSAPLFEGRPALERMSQGILGLYVVRTYLDAQRGGWA
jgi:uncharacterized protein (DUF2384 family)